MTMMMIMVALWIAFSVGLMIGWKWKPNWVSIEIVSEFFNSSLLQLNSFALPPCMNRLQGGEYENCRASHRPNEQSKPANLVTEKDLQHLCELIEMKDEDPTWIKMMDRSTPGMSYQAWRRDPKTGPPQYRFRTVFENATPEMVRDFFWDDEFRPKWDDMLANSTTIDECLTTGTMLVQWIRKFPFFCSDREYITGRRIWELEKSYYCVTKGVPCFSIPRRNNPRRVDLYYSSWCIRAVESRMGDGHPTACEVLFFHYEDMGIPWEIAKLGVRQGMWSTVKKFEPGLRAYQRARISGSALLSHHACMAQITTKIINPELVRSSGIRENSPVTEAVTAADKSLDGNVLKLLIFGGAIIVACSIEKGLLTKMLISVVGRKFANIGKKL